MHSRYIVLLGLILFKTFIFSEQNVDFKFEKVAPVVWAETDHHIHTQTKDSLILLHLDNTCSILKKSYPKGFQNCNLFYKQLIEDVFVDHCKEHLNFGEIDNKKTKATTKTHLMEQKTTKSRQLLIAPFVEGMVAIGTLVFGYESVQFAKIFHANYQTAIEQTKLVQSDILRIQQQSNELFRELTRKLKPFEIGTEMRKDYLRTSISLKELVGKAISKQDFSKEFKVVFGDIQLCEENNCPLNVSRFNGCYYKKNETDIDLVAFLIVTPLIIPSLKILEAHPFPIIYQENDKTCIYKYAGAKHLVFNTNSGCIWPLHISIPPESRPKSFRLMSSKGNCEKWQNNKENPTYSLDQCYSRSDLASYEMVWPHIEHDSDFVYVYCWNHTIRYNNISQPCENAVYRLPKYPPFYLNNVQSNKFYKKALQRIKE
ncbi:hypothetical protein BLOT_002242 [Blomia tropicalis]|nr:hypothetical protein BLOT_002242 [Blomia tropicalis]